jgi:anthranilate synthase/aminodeoxychorismate synthase-like glutamine amidotransferase
VGGKVEVFRNDEISIKKILDISPKAIILSPGPKRPEDAGICLELIKIKKDIPLLGICLGHQAIGQAYGGKIVKSKKIMHGKVDKVIHFGNKIFEGIKREFDATRYHSLIIENKTLPKNLEIIAKTNDNVIMGIVDKNNNTYGLQFHPESIGTKVGKTIFKNFLNMINYGN